MIYLSYESPGMSMSYTNALSTPNLKNSFNIPWFPKLQE